MKYFYKNKSNLFNQPTMNLNSAMMNAFQVKERNDSRRCDDCMDEAKRIAKRTFFKERKEFRSECGNDKEAMKEFESWYDVSRFVNVKCSNCKHDIQSPESKVICTPIRDKPKKTKPCSYTDFNEQCDRNKHILDANLFWGWDDGPRNQANTGDYFIFWVYDGQTKGEKGQWRSGHFIFHRVLSVCDPRMRLPSWSKNVGQTHRNVLELSPPKLTLSYDQMMTYGARPQYHGTKYPKTGFEKGSPLMVLIEQTFA